MAKNDKTAGRGNGGAGKGKGQAPAGVQEGSAGNSSMTSTPGLEATSNQDGLGPAGQAVTEQSGTVSSASQGVDEFGHGVGVNTCVQEGSAGNPSMTSTPGLAATSNQDGLGPAGQAVTEQLGGISSASPGADDVLRGVVLETRDLALVVEELDIDVSVITQRDCKTTLSDRYISVTAKTDGFRRAGMVFSTKPRVLNGYDLSAEQLEQLGWESQHGGGLIVVAVPAQKAEGQ